MEALSQGTSFSIINTDASVFQTPTPEFTRAGQMDTAGSSFQKAQVCIITLRFLSDINCAFLLKSLKSVSTEAAPPVSPIRNRCVFVIPFPFSLP